MQTPIRLVREGEGHWIAHLSTPYGPMELPCGKEKKPDVKCLLLIERFFASPTDHLAEIRRSAFLLARLWRPTRFAVNAEGRLAVKFKHRLTGWEKGLVFADKHSSFHAQLSEVVVTDYDLSRFRDCGTSSAAAE